MTIGERIKEARKQKGLTQAALAEKVTLKRNTIANYEIGLIEPSARSISAIADVLGLNEEWLKTGEGEAYKKLSPDEELSVILQKVMMGNDLTIKAIIKAYWHMPEEAKRLLRKAIIDIADQIKNDQSESPGQ